MLLLLLALLLQLCRRSHALLVVAQCDEQSRLKLRRTLLKVLCAPTADSPFHWLFADSHEAVPALFLHRERCLGMCLRRQVVPPTHTPASIRSSHLTASINDMSGKEGKRAAQLEPIRHE